ncbi:TetR/AcrR family transcriptional regulator [Mobilicoccus massiliensis]|uniref:TetR/AcrR family transcriptional regulator n=1 Tax=Mobilicoccus massiliensis TaxID=1522310 RepID=UPI000693DD02|nr:TetR/AcrR family transcriptional regulator [Mobilicoccus massiliensis]
MNAAHTRTTRERIVEAAIAVLAEQGMRGLTHRKVGERAGVTLGLVRYHFGSLDGLIEAVLHRMVELQRGDIMDLSDELRDGLDHEGTASPALWREAQASIDRVNARPDLALARFELLLHAARNPELQVIIRESRNTFVEATTNLMGDPDPRVQGLLAAPGGADASADEATATVENPEAAARMILATLDGLMLHQLSAHEPSVAEMSPAVMLATVTAAATLPARPEEPPGRGNAQPDSDQRA